MYREQRVTLSMLAVCVILAVVSTGIIVGLLTFCALRPRRRAEKDWEAMRESYNEKHDEKQDFTFPTYPERTYSLDLAKSYAGPPSPINAAPIRPFTSAWTASTISTVSLPLQGAWETERPGTINSNRFSYTEERPLSLKKGRSWKGVRLHSHKVSDGSIWG
jgi:hypothetical protein